MKKNFNILVHKLNKFRRRYYLFKILRGSLISLVLFLIIYLIISFVEFYSYLPSKVRIIEFYAFIIFVTILLIQFIIIPLLQLLKLTNQLSNKKINSIIVSHFPEIKDKLLNIIELAENDNTHYSDEIIWASIDQKIKEIKVFDLKEAISFKNLRFIFSYFIIATFILVILAIFDTPVLKESNYRIVNFKKEFVKPSPFNFLLMNNNLSVAKGEGITIQVKCEGEDIPSVVYINIEGNNHLMKEKTNDLFEYTIESCINSMEIFFTDFKYNSNKYFLKIIPKPNINSFSLLITPPFYTGLIKQEFKNVGDIKVPFGSQVEWNFYCIDTDSLLIQFNDQEKIKADKNENVFTFKKMILDDYEYSVYLGNLSISNQKIINYSISLIDDSYPEIDVVQNRDSFQYSRFYFKGSVADDYGFTQLNFHFDIENNDSVIPLQIIKSLTDQEFYFTYDFNQIKTSSNLITYYFSVTDNDVINNYKTTTSESFLYKIPNQEEIDNYEKEQFKDIQDLVSESQRLANEIKHDLKELQIKNLNSTISDWEKSQLVNDIINKKNELEKMFEKAKENNNELNDFMNSYTDQSSEILEKQEQLEQLLDEIFTEELKKLLEEFAQLAEEFDNNKMNQLSEELDLSLDDLSKQLDRNLEMLRRMKVEQKLQIIIDHLYQLSNDENKLAKELNDQKEYDKILQENIENENELERLEQQLEESLELNQQLKKPINFDDFDIEFNEIKKSFKKSNIEIDNKNRKKAARELQNNSDQIKNLAFNMNQMLQLNQNKSNMENIDNLKQILSNLLILSFSQEDILGQLSGIDDSDPKINELSREQKNIQNQSLIVKDSLYALANRISQINNTINNELLSVELNLNKTINFMEEGLISEARGRQQYIITSANNLALLLNEILDQIEKQLANAKPGDQQCENPKNGKGSSNMDMLKESTEGMKQQLQKMIEEMKKGNSKQMSKMLGESLMQHEMMQQMLREIMNNGNVGSEAKKQLQNVDNLLEQTRKELINKNISSQMLIRQNQILTRLLEAEKAEMERDVDNKRESETADDQFYNNPLKYFEYNEKKDIGLEKLEYNNYQLNNFYNKKYKQYINNFKEKDVNN